MCCLQCSACAYLPCKPLADECVCALTPAHLHAAGALSFKMWGGAMQCSVLLAVRALRSPQQRAAG